MDSVQEYLLALGDDEEPGKDCEGWSCLGIFSWGKKDGNCNAPEENSQTKVWHL